MPRKGIQPQRILEVTFSVKLLVPEGATANAATNYVRHAVHHYRAELDDQDPMKAIDLDKVTVSIIRRKEDLIYRQPGEKGNA